MNAGDPLGWYWEIPLVSRTYFTLSFLTTAGCALEVVSPLSLYFNYSLIVRGQLWRLVTSFLFFGLFSLDFVFHMYFLIRYCRLLEENSFRGPGRRADFVVFIVFCAVLMTLIAPFVNVPFMSSSLTFAMVHLWGRRNPHIRMNFLGLFTFTASYLSTVLFTFSLILGHSATVDLIGIVVGHIYYFWDDVYVDLARVRGWPAKHFLRLSTYLPQEPEIQLAAGFDLANDPLQPGPNPPFAQMGGEAPRDEHVYRDAEDEEENIDQGDVAQFHHDGEATATPTAATVLASATAGESTTSASDLGQETSDPILEGETNVPTERPDLARDALEDMRSQRAAAAERRLQRLAQEDGTSEEKARATELRQRIVGRTDAASDESLPLRTADAPHNDEVEVTHEE
ncbi:Derlin-2.2 [Hondaea fermentalgiana]|uniref:Derlin n=1 Tax=Hondaea fermentalgiana TaxID=2315210 RepID=A0A2R5GJ16_9STRA|nr:Derlin-2.2 [Hondaea fermentalgiana]|eukprot:GBG30309.1 Derlin-2.2 [Hondaea fermentalgiana]